MSKLLRAGLESSSDLVLPFAPVAPGKVASTSRIFRVGRRDGADGVAESAEVAVEHARGSAGSPLPGELRERFEVSLCADLAAVRIHTGGESAGAAAAVGARAYACGTDIHSGAGEYDPSSHEGQFLIAHEVAHTVQQGGSSRPRHKLEVSTPGDAVEDEADRAAGAMVRGEPATVSAAGAAIARQRLPAPSMASAAGPQLAGMQQTFHALMDEANQVARDTRFHYDYVNGTYAACHGIYTTCLGQAAAQAVADAKLRDKLLEGVGTALGLVPEAAAARGIVKVAQVAKKLADVGGKAAKLAEVPGLKPKEPEEKKPAVDPPDTLRLLGLEKVIELMERLATFRGDAERVFAQAIQTASEVGREAPESGKMTDDQAGAIKAAVAAGEAMLDAANAIMVDVRTLAARRAVKVPSWQETEQDLWLAHFASLGTAPISAVILNHWVDLGLVGPGDQEGGRLGLPRNACSFLHGDRTVEIPGKEDEGKQQSTGPQKVDLAGAIKAAASSLGPKWGRVMLLR